MCVYFNFYFSLEDKQFIVSINVDGHFLTKPVDELFHKHELITVPYMTGVNSDEAGLLVPRVSVSFTDFIFCMTGQHACMFETVTAFVSSLSSLVFQSGLRAWTGRKSQTRCHSSTLM